MRKVFWCLAAVAYAGTGPAAAAQSAPGQPATEAGGAFQSIRSGDSAMTCEALISEMMTLNVRMQEMQAAMTEQSMNISSRSMAAANPRGNVGSMAMSLGGMAAAFVPGGSLLMGAASAAAAAATQAQMERQQNQMLESTRSLSSVVADLGPMSQRVSHLAEIARAKSC